MCRRRIVGERHVATRVPVERRSVAASYYGATLTVFEDDDDDVVDAAQPPVSGRRDGDTRTSEHCDTDGRGQQAGPAHPQHGTEKNVRVM